MSKKLRAERSFLVSSGNFSVEVSAISPTDAAIKAFRIVSEYITKEVDSFALGQIVEIVGAKVFNSKICTFYDRNDENNVWAMGIETVLNLAEIDCSEWEITEALDDEDYEDADDPFGDSEG